MEREEAIVLLDKIKGRDLRAMAEKYEVTVFKEGKKNKGWAGHVIERYLGLPLNSAQSPNFGSWELKTASLKYLKSGTLTVKETLSITKIDAYNVRNTPFEKSHLLAKMQKGLIASRIWESVDEPTSTLYGIHTFDLDDPEVYAQVKADYDLVRKVITEEGFDKLSGKMGKYIQPRTKGTGHGSTTRAFYARVPFLKTIIDL